MGKLPLYIPTYPDHEISDCRWDEESQMYRVNVDGFEFASTPTLEQLKGYAILNRRRAAAFEALARCAEARENRLKARCAEDREKWLRAEEEANIRVEVMAEVGYIGTADGAYRLLGRDNPTAQRAVDLAVEARLKLERQGRA